MSLDGTKRTELPEHDSSIKRAVDKGVRAEKLGQDNQDKTAGTGQPGQESRDRRTGTGKSERETG